MSSQPSESFRAATIRILVVDDHPLMREGVAAVVGRQADMAMAGEAGSGEEAVDKTRELRPDVNRGWQVRNALQNGIHGYVSSECRIDELLTAVRRVHNGERYLCPVASKCIAESFSQQHLTPRELDVLRLVGVGLDNKTISRRLGIALGTVKAHVRTLLEKLGASSRTEAVAAGLRRGFIDNEVGAA